ncbi:MAG: hypothetical protein ACUVTX_08510 [Bacteroidales bacterium]
MKYLILCFVVIFIGTGCTNQDRLVRELNTKYTGMKPVLLSEPDSDYATIINPQLIVRTITVGGKGVDISGFTFEAVQTAIDTVHKESGIPYS